MYKFYKINNCHSYPPDAPRRRCAHMNRESQRTVESAGRLRADLLLQGHRRGSLLRVLHLVSTATSLRAKEQ